MKRPKLFLDMDGVFAGFDEHVIATSGKRCKDMTDEALWAHVDRYPRFFADLPVLPGAREFYFTCLMHADIFGMPIFLTSCPRTGYLAVAAQKREWIRKHICEAALIMPCLGSHNKPAFMNAPGDVLIDDFGQNTRAWTKAGGRAIKHENFADTRRALTSLLHADGHDVYHL